MGKFRSKLKGQTKGKRWLKGHSSSSNPITKKHRDQAKSRFFQVNLGNTGLTQDAIKKHNAGVMYSHGLGKQKSAKEHELSIAKDLEIMSIEDGDTVTASGYSDASGYTGTSVSGTSAGTYKTFQTFASDWSACSNASFSRLLLKFDSNNAVHKEMLAILAAVTEVIKDNGGKETTTEYFAAIMETIKITKPEEDVSAAVSLLSMGIKAVPLPVLRKQFSDSAEVFMDILERYANADNASVLRATIGCLSVLLRGQEYALWAESSTLRVFESLFAFAIHSKPKVRKAAQHAICAILRASCFMLPSDDPLQKPIKVHPCGARVADFCITQLQGDQQLGGSRTILYTLTLLKDIISVLSKDKIKSCCELILSLLSTHNVFIKTACLHTLHALLSANPATSNLSALLAAQLTRALAATTQPADATAQHMLAWLAVMQQAYICLAGLDIHLCLPDLPHFVNICVSELWHSDRPEINSGATNALKAILIDCIKVGIETEDTYQRHKTHIEEVFRIIGSGLDNPFNKAIKHVILTIAVCFEIGNERVHDTLTVLLKRLIERRESDNFSHIREVEYAVGCGVKSLGPVFVISAAPLRRGDDIDIKRNWLLPVLHEKIHNSTLEYFGTEILTLAKLCHQKSRQFSESNEGISAHMYDLYCSQLWALFPSFCNSPTDIKDNFKTIARVLGTVLKDTPDLKSIVLLGLRRMINSSVKSECSADCEELGRFAKNFLPLLMNIYMTPVTGSSANGLRLASLDTIQVYLAVCPQNLREELFVNSLEQMLISSGDRFRKESLLDIIRQLAIYQDEANISLLFEKWVYHLNEDVIEQKKVKTSKKRKTQAGQEETGVETNQLRLKDRQRMNEMEHKKAYRILEEIFKSDKQNCKEFLITNNKRIINLLLHGMNKAGESSKPARLRCTQHLLELTPELASETDLVREVLVDAVVSTRDTSTKCRQAAFDLVTAVGRMLQDTENGMESFMSMLLAGLDGTPLLVNASVRALATVVYNFSEPIGLKTLQGLVERVCDLILMPCRQIVAACLSFIKVYTKVIPIPVLSGSLPIIFKAISAMSEDCKRHSRPEIGYFLTRTLRKFGADVIVKLIPKSDEMMHKRLRNLRKLDTRKKKHREEKKAKGHDSDSDFDIPTKGTSKTLEDILADSDSDMEFLDEERPSGKKKTKEQRKKNQAWIQEDSETIVDLVDATAARNITGVNPIQKKQAIEAKEAKKKKEYFKSSEDGRLIIDDLDMESDGEDSSARKKGQSDSSDDSDDDEAGAKPSTLLKAAGSKRKYDDLLTVKSGQSGQSFRSYRSGGKGIHRTLPSSGASVKSAGSVFRATKAKGDVKRKGMPDPYAYLPLSRNALNKRKQPTNVKRFKGIVKSNTKGIRKTKGKK